MFLNLKLVVYVIPRNASVHVFCSHHSDNASFMRGVLREMWHGVSGKSLKSLKSDSSFPNNPDSVTTIEDFDAPINFDDNYGQRLTAYVQVRRQLEYLLFSSLHFSSLLFSSLLFSHLLFFIIFSSIID